MAITSECVTVLRPFGDAVAHQCYVIILTVIEDLIFQDRRIHLIK